MKILLFGSIMVCSFIFLSSFSLSQNSQKNNTNCCLFWQSKIDPTLGKSKTYEDPLSLADDEVLLAIDCLLKLEGNKNEASFGGAVNPQVSSVPQFTAVEVSALYYISYLYYQKFDHASIVALDDSSGEFSTQNAITEAYQSYRKWFEEVKKIGLAKAREQKLEPLAHTRVKWY